MKNLIKDVFDGYTLADWFLFVATTVLLTFIVWAALIIILIIGGCC